MSHAKRVAIIGAGPIGLEAAFQVAQAGLEPVVFEKGQVGDNVLSWGHVRLFSPFALNSSTAVSDAIRRMHGDDFLPDDDELLTGSEYAERYLYPLSELKCLEGCIHEDTMVESIARPWASKSLGQDRGDDGFELLAMTPERERYESAAVVLDCSGTYPNYRWIGGGGQGCPGEADELRDHHYTLQDIAGQQSDFYAGRHTLVVGSGYSAATAIVALGELIEQNPKTCVTWLTRGAGDAPIRRVEDDPLPERDRIAARANELAMSDAVEWITDQRIVRLNKTRKFLVLLETRSASREERRFDNVVAHAGFRPDTSMYEELQVHAHPATDGPFDLASELISRGGDCLNQAAPTAESLSTSEPGFFVLGSKSYGRSSQFLIQDGLKQISAVMPLVQKHCGLG